MIFYLLVEKFRTINLPQSRHRNRRHLLTSTSAHSTTRNYEVNHVRKLRIGESMKKDFLLNFSYRIHKYMAAAFKFMHELLRHIEQR